MNLLFVLFSRELDFALSWTMLHSLWQGTLIALLLSLVLFMLPRRQTRVRYLLANIFLLLVLCSSVVTFLVQYQKAKERFNVVYVPATTVAEVEKSTSATTNTVNKEENNASSLQFSSETFSEYFNQHFPLIVMIWGFGVCVFVIRLLGGVSYIYYLKQRMNFPPTAQWLQVINKLCNNAGVQRRVSLVESAMVRTPIVVGFIKPMILLPFGLLNRLTQEEAEAVLAHEIAHVLRHDYLFNIIQSVIESLFYYHPAIWWISSIIRNERESACDEIAVRMTGNAISYAKALVAVQELALTSPRPALAFAGQGKSQFMFRIQRILKVDKYKRNYMEKIITVLSIFILLTVLAFSQQINRPAMPKIQEGTRLQENSKASGLTGIWEATIEGEKICITFSNATNGAMWLGSECFDKSSFSAIPATESSFTIKREPGTIHFKGKFTGNKGSGSYYFEADESYRAYLSQQGIKDVSDEILLHAFLSNLNRGMISKLQNSGYKNITRSQFSDLAIHNVNEKELTGYLDYFKEQNYTPANADKITELKIHGVNLEYISAIKALGYGNTPVPELLRAKTLGVSPAYIAALKGAGYDKLTMNEIANLRIHEVDANYITELNTVSGEKLSVAQLLDAKIHAVDPKAAVKVKSSTGGGTSFDESKKMAIRGVDAAYIDAMNNAGFGTLTKEQLLNAKTRGINADYVKNIKALNIPGLAFDDVVNLKVYAIDAAYISGLQQSGITGITVDKLIYLKVRDVTPAYMQTFKAVFGRNLSEEEVLQLRQHAVTASFVEEFQQLGFKEITPRQVLKLKIYDVKPSYIDVLKKRGINPSTIEEVISRRIRE